MRKPYLLIGLALMCAVLSGRIAADPNALWRFVHEQCVPNKVKGLAPTPCADVALANGEEGGYAIFKDRVGPLQYLLIPTARISGIESPVLLNPATTDYWAEAWEARRFMIQKYGRPIAREAIALAINSTYGRSQDQLHIHISCVKKQVYQQVVAAKDGIGTRWQPLPGKLLGHDYLARRIDAGAGDTVATRPFLLLANEMAGARGEMGRYTLAMVATTFSDGRDGFVLLADRADLAAGDRASAEELQDHDCRSLMPR